MADFRKPAESTRSWPEHYERWLDFYQMADELGASSICLAEHHFFTDGFLPQPLTVAAALAARTRRARLATTVLLATLRHPLHLAEEAALVDILSSGRLDLGIGVGYGPGDYEAFGVDMSKRYQIIEQTIIDVRDWWANGVMPPPIAGEVPMWGGFFGPRGARLAGRYGMGLLPSAAAMRNLLEPYREGLVAGGHGADSARMRVPMRFMLATDVDRATELIAPGLTAQRASYQQNSSLGGQASEVPQMDEFQVLTVDEAEVHVKEITAMLPIEEIIVWGRPGLAPEDLAEQNVRLLCTELLPRLTDWDPMTANEESAR
jgi:alkanesulfonate monooxygenase SsuD/methylene tetrahydromethanopterin reductase-like flavin-dependent oxidoreductase (luciferase family)